MAASGIIAAIGMVGFVISLVVYLYFAWCLYTMAKKTSTPYAWMAWIPVLNIFLFVKVAGKSYWWIILLLIPLVNIVAMILLYMSIAERLRHPSWLGVLMIIPVVNLVIPGYLAFATGTEATAPAAPMPPTP